MLGKNNTDCKRMHETDNGSEKANHSPVSAVGVKK